MTHVFISPHPDDAALSCGGLIASLRELGQSVTIISVFSGGPEAGTQLTEYQRTALGFGRQGSLAADRGVRPQRPAAGLPGRQRGQRRCAVGGRSRADRRDPGASQHPGSSVLAAGILDPGSNVTNVQTVDRPLADSLPGQGTLDGIDFDSADAAAIRRGEDARYAWFMESSLVDLGLPDAVYRGYQGDAELLGGPRPDDAAPLAALRREIMRLEPQQVYFPLGIGGHVDHVLCREIGLALLQGERGWVMPAPDLADKLSFYEDFPYAWWNDFEGQVDLPIESDALGGGRALQARYADISEFLERKVAGLRVYTSQIEQLFHSDQGMLDDVAGYARRVAFAGGVGSGSAERYWSVVRP